MKRFTLLLSAMLLACATNLWADVATYKVTSTSAVTSLGDIPEGASATYKSTYSSAYQLTNNNSMTLTLKGYEGYVITGITLSMKSNASAGAGKFSAKAGTTTLAEISTATNFNAWFDNNAYTTSYKDIHVMMSNGAYTIQTGEDVVIVIAATTNSLYCSSFTITYAKPAAVPTPVFYAYDNVNDVENNGFYTSDLLVEIECDDYDAVIRYTTDGTEPTAESDIYDAETVLSFTNEFVTLRAKAFKGEDASYEATANYYHNSSLEVPYTTTQAVALYNALGDVEEVFVKGSVDGNPTYYESSSSSNYDITDGTTPLYMYRGVAGDGCGLADLANLVQGDKVVVKGKLTAYKGTPQLGAGNTIVKWTENTTPVLTCDESVAFGNISSLVGTAPSKTLEVTAKNLTEDIIVTLSDGAAFTLDESEFDVRNGGTLTITPVLTVGENTATLKLTSGEKSVVVTLTATVKQAYTISWSVNGKVTSTSHVIDGETLVLPATPEAPNECASKVFVGWATTATVAANGKDIVFVDAATPATADATYYAVFATATESETPAVADVTFSNMFSDVTSSKDIDGVALVITDGITVTFAKSTSGSNKAQYYDNGKAVRLYGGGSITINSIVTITSFMLTFGDNDGNNVFTADCGTWESPIWTGSANTIVLTEEGTTGNRRIAGISVTTKQTTWEEYTTTCTDTPSAIDNTSVETSVVKTIENGQLIILRDGVKYNAMGVRLQ